MKLHKGDNIKVLSGKDRNKTGKILEVFRSNDKVLVEGVNLFKSIAGPRRQAKRERSSPFRARFMPARVALVRSAVKQPALARAWKGE